MALAFTGIHSQLRKMVLKSEDELTTSSAFKPAKMTKSELTLLNLCLQKASNLVYAVPSDPKILQDCQEMIPDLKYKLLQHLCKIRLFNDTALLHLLPNTTITKLCLPYTQITDEGLRLIANYCVDLQELDIRSCEACTHEGLLCVAKACSKLTVLDISHCKKISTKGLVAALEYTPNLLVLGLRYWVLVANEMEGVLPKYCPLLRQLEITANTTSLPFLNDIASLNHLQWLNIGWCKNVQEQGLVTIARARGPNLIALNAEMCPRIGDNFVLALAENCPNLQMVSLNNLRFLTSESVCALVTNCKHLQALHISGCVEVTDDILIALANNNPHISTLSMAGLPLITDAALTEIEQKCQDLTMIDLANCIHISPAVISKFGSKVLTVHPDTNMSYIPFKLPATAMVM